MEVACGKIIQAVSKVAVLKLTTPSYDIARGNQVREEGFSKTPKATATRVAKKKNRKPASLLQTETSHSDSEKIYFHNLSAGVSVGLGFYFPMLHFQRLVGHELAIGVMPIYFRVGTNTGSLSSLGGYITVNYYHDGYFKGLWFQGAVGAYFLSHDIGGLEEEATSLSALTTLGWRSEWDFGANIGLAVGAQYLKDPKFSVVSIQASNIQPLLLLDIGIKF